MSPRDRHLRAADPPTSEKSHSGQKSQTPWVFEFRYFAEHDFVLARYRGVVLSDDADARRWRAEVEREFRRIGRIPVDTLIDLDGLVVKPRAFRGYGAHRLQIIQLFCKRTIRFGGDVATRTSVLTSSVIDRAHANLHATFDEAVAALEEARRNTPDSSAP